MMRSQSIYFSSWFKRVEGVANLTSVISIKYMLTLPHSTLHKITPSKLLKWVAVTLFMQDFYLDVC